MSCVAQVFGFLAGIVLVGILMLLAWDYWDRRP